MVHKLIRFLIYGSEVIDVLWNYWHLKNSEFFSFLGTERVKYNIFDNDAFFTLSMEL